MFLFFFIFAAKLFRKMRLIEFPQVFMNRKVNERIKPETFYSSIKH